EVIFSHCWACNGHHEAATRMTRNRINRINRILYESEGSVSRFHSTVLRFLEHRESTDVRMGKQHAPMRLRQPEARLRKDRPRDRTRHRMTEAHHVHPRYTVPDIRMRSLEIVEYEFLPLLPRMAQQQMRCPIGNSVIPRPNRAVDARPQRHVCRR